MTIPKHSDDIRPERQAVAPYNFVPLPETLRLVENPPSQGIYDKNLLTGKITCKLINSTPMYVRAAQTLTEHKEGKPSSEPFYYGSSEEQLVIPGSSIRGMLRTLIEVISQARIAPVSDKQLFYRSVEDTSMGKAYTDRMREKVRAGFFHRNQAEAWITPTVALRVEREKILAEFGGDSLYKEQYRNGKRLKTSPKRVPRDDVQHKPIFVQLHEKALENPTKFYTTDELSRTKLEDTEPAVLIITGDMKVPPAEDGTEREKKEFAFLKRSIAPKIILLDEQVELFEDRDQLTQYQEEAFQGSGRKAKGYLKDGDPIFYLVGEDESKVVGFGRAYMFRLPYQLSPAQMLPDTLASDPNRYDLVEALFGYIPGSKTGRKAVASRVMICDALMRGDTNEALLPEMQLKILSSPKATSFQHYLTQEHPNQEKKLYHYDTPKTQTTLRGHKFYWHKGVVDDSDFIATEREIRNFKKQLSPPVKPIKAGQFFTFTIRFENLRQEELGALLWILDKAGNEKYRLKLGMGTPQKCR